MVEVHGGETIIVDDLKANLIDTEEKLRNMFNGCPLKKIIVRVN